PEVLARVPRRPELRRLADGMGEPRADARSAHLRAAHVNHGRLERSVRPRRGPPTCFLSGSDVRPTLRSRTRPRADRKTRQTTFRSGSSGGTDAAIGLRVRAATLVVGSDVDPATLRHPHIRAHALEGRLYREAVEAAASRCGLACEVLVEGEALPSAAVAVGKRPVEIKAATDAWGKA